MNIDETAVLSLNNAKFCCSGIAVLSRMLLQYLIERGITEYFIY